MKKLLLFLLGLGFASTAYGAYSLPPTIQKGDLIAGNSSTQMIRIPTSTTGSVLSIVNNVPTWVATSTLGFITDGILPIANGGTNQSSYTTNGVLFYDGTQFNTSANSFFWNGSSLSLSVGGGASHTALLDVNGSLRINGEFLLNASAGSSGDLIVSAGAGNPPQWQSKATADIAEASRTISTTAPLAGGGDLTADRTFSIAQSSSGVDGYLSGTDWDTFNNKVSSQWVTSGSNIYYTTGRVAINTTTFVSTLSLGASTTASGGINFGDASTNLYRTGNSSLKTDAAMYASAGFFSQYFIDATNAKGFWNTGVSGINWRNENRVTTNINVQLLGIASQTADLFQVASSSGAVMLNVTSQGRLGIGTSSPVAQLHIQGTSTAPTVPLLTLSSSTGSTLFTVTPAGNVGIGTTTPIAKLEVLDSGYGFRIGKQVSVNRNLIEAVGANTTLFTSPGSTYFLYDNDNSGSNDGFLIGRNSNTDSTATIDLAVIEGNVGIGTTSPTSLLHVAGTFTATGSTTLNSLTTGVVRSSSGSLFIGPIDISGDTNLAAGRSLTLTGDSIEADVELYTSIKSISITSASGSISATTTAAQAYFPLPVTITRIVCSTDVGTATIQFDERAEATPNTAGTDVMTGTLACDSNSEATTSFSNASIASRVPLNLDIDSVASSPTRVRIHVEFTIDE